MYVPRGSAWIGAIDMESGETHKVVLSDKSPKILYIPPGYYNGFQTLEEGTILLFFSTVTMEEGQGDDFRKPYEDYPIFNKDYR